MRLLVATIVILTGVTVMAQNPASADSALLQDPDAPGETANVTAVRVDHYANATGTGGRVKVVVWAGSVDYGDEFEVWLDTPGATNPRYYASIVPEAGYGAVMAVDGWTTHGKAACQRWDAHLVTGANKKAIFSIPRACLGDPTKVRAATRATYVRDGQTIRDWTRDVRKFGAWVAVSSAT
jgi:hypothetical protein